MQLIRKVIRQYRIFKPLVATKNVLYGLQERERKKSYGLANPDATFYIIRCINSASRYYTGPKFNLLANYSYVLSHLHYAREHGYRPLIDQLHYPVYNTQTKPVNGTMNPWEFFWCQPGGGTLQEAYRSRNVILSQRNWISKWNLGYDIQKHQDPTIVSHLHMLSELVPLNSPTEIYVNHKRQMYFSDHRRVMGVSYRFGGHAKNSSYHAASHPIQPEMDDLVRIVERRLKMWNLEAVFLATESADAVERFKKAFGHQLIVTKRLRQSESVAYCENPMYQQDAIYQTSLDYLTEMELLAKCTALTGTITSGLRYAIIRNNNAYEHLEILDFGRFHDPRHKQSGKEAYV